MLHLLFVLSLNLLLQAQPHFTQESGKVILADKNCSEIEKSIQQFSQPDCAKKIKKGIFDFSCEYDLKSCLPERMRDFHGVKAQINGLNSWNLAMYVAQVSPVLRASSAEEFAFFMNSPLCKIIADAEEKQPMDIVALREEDNDEVSA